MARRPRFTTPLTIARDAFVRYVVRPLDVFPPNVRFLIGFAFLVVVTALLLFSNYSSGFSENYKEGEVVKATVVAPADINTVDIGETERKRIAARETTRPVFNFDSTRRESSAQSFRAAWEDLRKLSEDRNPGLPTWTGEGGAAVARAIIAHHFDSAELERLTGLIREIGGGYIYDDNDANRLKQEIVLVDIKNPTAQMIMPAPQTRMTPLSSARRSLELRVRNLSTWSQEEKTALASAIAPLIKPNVVLDQTATTTLRETEASKVPPVVISLKRNQVIVREGEPVTAGTLAQLEAIRNSGRAGRPWQRLVGLLLLVTALYWVAWKFTEHRSTAASLSLSKDRAFALVASAILVETAL